MGMMTATEFAKNIKKTLDRLEFGGEEIIVTRNNPANCPHNTRLSSHDGIRGYGGYLPDTTS